MNEEKHNVSANPEIPTVKLGLGQRAIGKLVNLSLDQAPSGPAQADLAGDLFWNLYTDPAAVAAEELPGSRQVNQALLNWFKSAPGWHGMKTETAANMPLAQISSGLAWGTLSSEEALAEALEAQRKAEEAEAEAAQRQAEAAGLGAAAQAAAQGEGNEEEAQALAEAAAAAQAAAAQAQAAAEAATAQALEALGEAQEDPRARAAVMAAAQEVAEEARETAAVMASYGLEAGSTTSQDPEAAARFMEKMSHKLKEIAKVAGRFRGIAMQASREKIEVGHILGEVVTTQNLTDLLPTELAYLSQGAPGFIRAEKVAQFLDYGLSGYDRHGEAKEEGPVVIMVDGSGSMEGLPEIVAKGVALGVGQAKRAEGRPFILGTFSSRYDPVYSVSDEDTWDQVMEWAGLFQNGGTSFSAAFKFMIGALDQLAAKAAGADVIFITDGHGDLDQTWRDRWAEYKAEKGTRFLMVPVGGFSVDFLGDIPDQVINLSGWTEEEGAKLAAGLGEWIR